MKLTNQEIIMEIYRRMFKEAEPSANIDEIINFFMKYYLNQDRQDEIIEEVCKENKRGSRFEIDSFHTACDLGSSPTENREVMLRERDKLWGD